MSNLKRSIFGGQAALLIGAGFALLIMSSRLAGCGKSSGLQAPDLDTFQVTTQGLVLTKNAGSVPADGVTPATVQLTVADSVTEYYNSATFTVNSAVFANGSTSMTVPLVAGTPISVYLVSRTVGTATVTVTVGGASNSIYPAFDTAYATALSVAADSAVLDSVLGKSTQVTVMLLRPGQGLPTPNQLVSFSSSDLNDILSPMQVLSDTSGKAVTNFSLTDLSSEGSYITITAMAPPAPGQKPAMNYTRVFIP
jgi:hypothetical protein